MLLTGHEKSIPLSYIYPEFAADTWESHEAYVRGTIKRQQEIHELVRRNMHQAQVRQKKYFDRRVKGKAFAEGDQVWVFCNVIPKGGSSKLLSGWRGPYTIVEVFQEGRVYALSSGHKVHFERLKRHVNSPTEWKANLMEEEVKVHFDPNPEESVEEVGHDIVEDSFFEETPHSGDEVEHQGATPQGERREIQTRTRTALDEGRERKYFTQYGYSSSSDEAPLTQDPMLPHLPETPTDPIPPAEQMLSDVLDFRAQTDPEDQLDDVPNLLDWSTPSPADLKIDTSPEEQVSIGEPGPSRPRERTPAPPRRIPSPNKVRTRRRAREEETTSAPAFEPEPIRTETHSPEQLGADGGRRLSLRDICPLHLHASEERKTSGST